MTKTQQAKLRTRALLLGIILFSFASFAYGHDPQYDDQNYTYRSGYTAGFQHGNQDQQAKTDFDFRHGTRDRTALRNDYNNDSRQDLNFRLGYMEGYSDGYFRRNPSFDFQRRQGTNGHYNQNNRHYNQNNQNYGYSNRDTVTVFTETSYSGYSREFSIGQYSSLEGRLDDDIQSVRLNGNVRLIMFEDSKFRGKRIILDGNSQNLGDFRKEAGSMIIEPIRYGQLR